MPELISKLFAPGTALLIVVVLGIFTTIYTAIIRFFFGRKLKSFEIDLKSAREKDLEQVRRDHSIELKALDARLTAQNQMLVQNVQAEHNRDLKKLEADLTRTTQAEQAWRDYEYEARKHLYHECEPLIFQFVELSEDALYRIESLATRTRQGYLPDWFYDNEYYMNSTMYQLLAPLVVYKLIRRRLTVVDLRLDGRIAVHYRLAKHLAWSFTADFELAWGLKVHPLDYDSNNPDWRSLRQRDPARYWRQGLPIGRFDKAVESLIACESEPAGRQLVMSFGEFESGLHTPESKVAEAFEIVRDMMTGFDPGSRPVLWRMLITQAHIYDAVVRFNKEAGSDSTLVVVPIPKANRQRFYWRRNPDETERQLLEQPFAVGEAYLQKWLGSPLFQG